MLFEVAQNTDTQTFLPEALLAETEKLLQAPRSEAETLALQRLVLQLKLYINPDLVENVYGVKTLEKCCDRPEGEDCFGYVAGSADVIEYHNELISGKYALSSNPAPGAIVVYMNEEFDPKHIGRVTENLTVISKWSNLGHVYEHDPLMLPFEYGNPVYFSEMGSLPNDIRTYFSRLHLKEIDFYQRQYSVLLTV